MSKFHSFALALALCASSLFADRVVTDQLGRDVTLPDEVKRIVVLQHQSLNALNELNALDKVVGVQESWEKSLGKNYIRLAPSLKDMPTPGDLKVINYEAVLKAKAGRRDRHELHPARIHRQNDGAQNPRRRR